MKTVTKNIMKHYKNSDVLIIAHPKGTLKKQYLEVIPIIQRIIHRAIQENSITQRINKLVEGA